MNYDYFRIKTQTLSNKFKSKLNSHEHSLSSQAHISKPKAAKNTEQVYLDLYNDASLSKRKQADLFSQPFVMEILKMFK